VLGLLSEFDWARAASLSAYSYAPKAEHLPLMARLFAENFSGMRVETLAAGDPRLKAFHQLCPSRTSPNLG
jgi:hypothetical protein